MPTQELASGIWWEVVKGVLLFASTGILGIIAKASIGMRDDLRDLKRDIRGVDGTNGLKSEMRSVIERLDAADERFLVMDTVAEIDAQHYEGPERRHAPRRGQDYIREMIRAELAQLHHRDL